MASDEDAVSVTLLVMQSSIKAHHFPAEVWPFSLLPLLLPWPPALLFSFCHLDCKFRGIFVTCVSSNIPMELSSGYRDFKEFIGTQVNPTIIQLKMPSFLLVACWDSSEHYFCPMGVKLRAPDSFPTEKLWDGDRPREKGHTDLPVW